MSTEERSRAQAAAPSGARGRDLGVFTPLAAADARSQEEYERIKRKFAEQRDLRLRYRPEGTSQYTTDLTGALAQYETDPCAGEAPAREPIDDTVECLFIGGGFSALLTSARLREHGVESIRIVERGADVGGTWYWNRYPGVACDVPAYDYLPLLDELDYVRSTSATTGRRTRTGRALKPGWQAKRRERTIQGPQPSPEQKAELAALTREEKIRAQENANIEHMMRIHARIDSIVTDPATAASLKPWYMFMCKRPCFDDEYLPAFNRPNVHLVDTRGKGITEITERGPLFAGRQFELDVLIYATGFEVQKTGIYNRIVGRAGLDLEDKDKDGIRTLYGIHSRGFPNLFIMGGYQASFQFNLTDLLQAQGDHIAACIAHVRRDRMDERFVFTRG